ncbi:zinc ribbon domain-containing protein [Streptomyces sp. NPDC003233]
MRAESAGRLVIPVNARNTSRTCPVCGHIAKGNRVTQSRFECAYLCDAGPAAA